LGILRALYESGTPAQVLLSKADLLTPPDRQRMATYVQEQLQRELGLSLAIHPVSTIGSDEALLTRWFEQEIGPLLNRHRALTEASLRRKIGHLHESVVAVLQTLLANLERGNRDGRTRSNVTEAKRLLERADDAVRQARARCQDWTAEEAALVEIILRDAAQAVVASAGAPERTATDPVQGAIQQVLTERGRMAHELVKELQQALGRTLEGLRQAAPLANADPTSVQNLVFSGMPILDLASFQDKYRGSRPWWSSVLPQAAVWTAERSLRRNLEPAIREYVALYDRQLRAWLKGCIAQLVELYESQAEVFREQVRRLTVEVDGAASGTDRQQLTADLQELQGTEAAEKMAAALPASVEAATSPS